MADSQYVAQVIAYLDTGKTSPEQYRMPAILRPQSLAGTCYAFGNRIRHDLPEILGQAPKLLELHAVLDLYIISPTPPLLQCLGRLQHQHLCIG